MDTTPVERWEPLGLDELDGPGQFHRYLSTACYHGQREPDPVKAKLLHEQCRVTCKFCGVTCICRDCRHPDQPVVGQG